MFGLFTSQITRANTRASLSCVKFNAKAQAAFEYLVILGIILVVLLPAVYIFYSRSQTTSDQIAFERLSQMGNDIVSGVAYVYPFGYGSKTTLNFNSPVAVTNITVRGDPTLSTGYEFVINLQVRGVNQSMVYFSKYPMFIGNCTSVVPLPSDFLQTTGQKTFQIISCGANVSIYKKQ